MSKNIILLSDNSFPLEKVVSIVNLSSLYIKVQEHEKISFEESDNIDNLLNILASKYRNYPECTKIFLDQYIPSLVEKNERAKIDNVNKVILISTWGTANNSNIAEVSALFIFAVTNLLNFNLENAAHSDSCFFDIFYVGKKINYNICTKCQEAIGKDISRVFDQLRRIISISRRNYHGCVIILHGIRSYAEWADEISDELRKNGFYVKVVRYGNFPLFKFYFGKFFEKRIITNFYKKYKEISRDYPSLRISIICHSYGSFVVSRALESYNDFNIDKLIIAGGIIPSDFDWKQFHLDSRIFRVLNECGSKDIWPVLASKFIWWGADASGTFYYYDDDQIVFNIRYPGGHSDLLNLEHCKNVWLPYLLDDNNSPQRQNVSIEWCPRFIDKLPNFNILIIIILLLCYYWFH